MYQKRRPGEKSKLTRTKNKPDRGFAKHDFDQFVPAIQPVFGSVCARNEYPATQ
jgi:hypothetical protein